MVLGGGGRTYPLLVQFHQLLGDFGRVERQAEARQVQLREEKLQHVFDGQPASGSVLGGGRHRILQDGAAESRQLQSEYREEGEN